MNTIAQQLAHHYPESNEGRGIVVSAHPNMSPGQRDSMRSLLGLLEAAVCLVLLIACGNAANIMLARTAARSREIAIRLAIGANRWLLMQQLLAESFLLGLGGGLLGLMLAPWILPVFRAAGDSRQFRATGNAVDLPVLLFTLGFRDLPCSWSV